MLARTGALGFVCIAVFVTASGASASRNGLLVEPRSPVVGERVTIDVETPPLKRTSMLFVELISPTRVPVELLLKRVSSRHWRATYHFQDEGQWGLRVSFGRIAASTSVFVKQPPSAVPPYRPKGLVRPSVAILPGLGSGIFLPWLPWGELPGFARTGRIALPHARPSASRSSAF